jgi:hypothetical protein
MPLPLFFVRVLPPGGGTAPPPPRRVPEEEAGDDDRERGRGSEVAKEAAKENGDDSGDETRWVGGGMSGIEQDGRGGKVLETRLAHVLWIGW